MRHSGLLLGIIFLTDMEDLLRGSIWHYYSSVFFWWANLVFFEFLIFVFASYFLGKLILRVLKIDFMHNGERAIYSVMLGYGAFGLFGMWLAVFGVFNAFLLRIFLAVIFLVSIKDIFRAVKFAGLFREHTLLKIVLIFWIFANFLIAFHPVTGIDARVYHLPIIFDLIKNGYATFSADVSAYYSYLPVLAEIIYAVPTAIFGNNSDPYVFQLLQYSAVPLLLGLIYFLLKDLISDKLLIFSAIFFVAGNFDLQREALHAGYIDVLTYLFAIGSVFLLIKAFRENDYSKYFLLSAIFLGLGLGMKYTAIFFGAINLLFSLIFFYTRRMDAKKSARTLLFYGLVLFVISGFWYAKNLWVFGNPIYPMLSSADFADQIGWFIAERTTVNLLFFPFIRFGQWFFDATQSSSNLAILAYFVSFYLLWIFFLARRIKIGTSAILLSLFVQTYLSIVFFFSHQPRFLLPATIILAPALIVLLDSLFKLLNSGMAGRYGPMLVLVSRKILAVVCLILFLGNFHYFGVKFLYLIGFYDRATYILEIGGQ